MLQGYGFLNLLKSQNILGHLGFLDTALNVLLITAGSMMLLWIGELISEQKIGNGVSLIIFAGIVSGLPNAVKTSIVSYDPAVLPSYLAFAVISVIVIAGVVFISEGERKIPFLTQSGFAE